MDSFDEEAEQHATSPAATDTQQPTGNPVESLQQYRSKRKLTTHLKGATNLDHSHNPQKFLRKRKGRKQIQQPGIRKKNPTAVNRNITQ